MSKIKTYYKYIFLILVVTIFSNCKYYKKQDDIKFNKNGWNFYGDGIVYPNRDIMLNDLLKNHKLKGLSYKQLIEKLGKSPDYDLIYEIVVFYGYDIDPEYVKILEFKLDKDSIVKGWNVIENPSNY